MRINHNISAINTYRQYNMNTQRASKSMEKLSSGLRINRAADDAAGLSISEKMRGEIALVSQRIRNTQDHISMIQTAEGALNEVSDMLVRMKELVTQRGNATYTEDDIYAINLELAELAKAIGKYKNGDDGLDAVDPKDSTAEAKFNDYKITFGTNDLDDGIISSTQFNGKPVFEDKELVGDYFDTFEGLTKVVTEFYYTEVADSNERAKNLIENAMTTVNKVRAKLGALQNRYEHEINNDNTYYENLQAAESRIRDVDMAEEMMEYTKNNILVQAAQSMLAQANYQPQGILQLLQ